MNETVRAYLEKLYAEIGGGVGFDIWLEVLHSAYLKTGGSAQYVAPKTIKVRVPSVGAIPEPTYSQTPRGIRR